MSAWFFLIAPLAVLAILLLFRFTGCAAIAGLDDYQPAAGADYPKVIKAESSLVAYWRLGEPSSTPIPSSGGAAASETHTHNGDYDKLKPVSTVDKGHHSPVTAGTISLGNIPGLLERSTSSPCISVDGAFVAVPFDDTLNPPQFSFEAWILPDKGSDPDGNFYCVLESTGPQGLGQKMSGWGLYFGPADATKTPPGPYFWQVWMGNGKTFAPPKGAISTDVVKFKQLTYLMLTFDGTNLQLFLYYPDTGQILDVPHIRALQANVTTFKRNDTSKIGGGDFFLCTGSNLFPAAGIPTQRLYPFKGKIQEAALYSADLSAPNNAGLAKIASHESTGGNF
jgi:hypothetical protein